MSSLFEGNCIGKPVNVEIGLDGGGHARARWDMEVTEGEHKGKVAKYSGKLSGDNVKWTKRDMMAIGWQGQKSATFVDDVKKANRAVAFEAQIASYNGNEWTAAKFGGAPPLASLDSDKERELDRAFAEAGDVGGGGSNGAPQAGSDRVPF